MKLRKIYFSPNGGTKKIVNIVAEALDCIGVASTPESREATVSASEPNDTPVSASEPNDTPVSASEPNDTPVSASEPDSDFDFTLPESRIHHYSCSPDDLVIFACPTYAGKLPNKILPFIQNNFSGKGASAIAIVTFGNRSFDNSLAELVHTLKQNNFNIVGAAAFVAPHAFSQTLGAGRPDEEDLALIQEFAMKLQEKQNRDREAGHQVMGEAGNSITAEASHQVTGEAGNSITDLKVPGTWDAPYYTPLGIDGNPTVFLKAKPATHQELCNGCGLCANLCPMGAISKEDPAKVPGTCIKCHACVNHCPRGAKYFNDLAFLSHKEMLENTYTRKAESMYFI